MVTDCRRPATRVTRRTLWPPAYRATTARRTRPASSVLVRDGAIVAVGEAAPEGAEIAFFSQLNASKPWHRAVAWVALFVMFGVPVLLRILDWLHV